MMMRRWLLPLGAIACIIVAIAVASKRPKPELLDIGPRVVSNQTSQPLALVGRGFVDGMTLTVSAPFSKTLPITRVDATHAYARLPGELAASPRSDAQVVEVAIGNGKPLKLRVINDAAFVDLTVLVASGDLLYAASTTTDTLFRIEPVTGAVQSLPAGDGPSAIATFDEAGAPRLAIAHRWEKSVWICDGVTGLKLRSIPAPAYASAIVVDGDALIVAEQAHDKVHKITIADGAERFSAPVDPNPKALALLGDDLFVGSLLTGRIERLDRNSGSARASISPTPRTRIIGGHTEPFSRYIMGGKAQRDFAIVGDRLLSVNIGPNIGPNPEKMEVAMNGGVSVVDLVNNRVETHLGFGFGVPEALVVDHDRGLVYVADIGAGLIRVIDATKLTAVDAEVVRHATLWSIPIAPPRNFPLTRPIVDFAINKRSGVELHSGPYALALSPDKRALYVLNRFSGTLAVLEVGEPKTHEPTISKQLAIAQTLNQRERRLGQVLYFTDLGRTGMSCDACHLEGHAEGVLFEKTTPLRIYRSPTVRGTTETPPYFVPASAHSLLETNRKVGDRNRYQNPIQTADEVTWLTIYASEVTTLPNPYVGDDGAPPETLPLPDGKSGHPRIGLTLFEGKARCATCHPAPYFTQDQVESTRNRFIEVGTPHKLLLRPELQSDHFQGFSIPALIGAWDVWPMLNTGSAGFAVDGDMLTVTDRVPLRAVLERFAHGETAGQTPPLTSTEIDDLLAYLLTL